jgi:ABC-type branched-subunit amino acid transport system ATPase component
MQYAKTTAGWTEHALEDLSEDDPRPLRMQDRAVPGWALALSILFSGGAAACFVSLMIFIAFYQDLVAAQGQEIMAYLLTLGALVPVLGILVFEIGHNRALSGYRHIRERHEAFGHALIATLVTGGLGFLDPLLLVPFVAGAVMSWIVVHPVGRLLSPERLWDFLPGEAVSFLSGRDRRAVELANSKADKDPVVDSMLRAVRSLALMGTVGLCSWLTARDVLSMPAIASIGFLNFWATQKFANLFKRLSIADPEMEGRAASVVVLPDPTPAEENENLKDGLKVRNLTITTTAGQPLVSDISFDVAPGSIVGLCGDEFAGKSLLMQSLAAPHDLRNLEIKGYVSLAGDLPWIRSPQDRDIATVLVPPVPLTAPGGGLDNLCCFSSEREARKARRVLKSLVYNTDTADHICEARDAGTLSGSDRKALALARALYLRPRLFLFDRPEDGASVSLLNALSTRIHDEKRLGAIFLIATENRQLLDACDKLLMLQNGRLIELAPASEINARRSAGWMRFVSERDLESEEALDSWICAQFRRDGDETNRRNVCMIANEILALSCQPRGGRELDRSVNFEFKHQKGYCILQTVERDSLISSAALEKARQEAERHTDGETLSPLGRIVKHARSVEMLEMVGKHLLQVMIETYDPRETQAQEPGHHAKQTG